MNDYYKYLLTNFLVLFTCVGVFAQKGFQLDLFSGYGVDLSIGKNINHYTYDIDGQNGGVDIQHPFVIGADIGYQFNKLGLTLGVLGTKRPLKYIYKTEKANKDIPLKIRYWVYEVPIGVFYQHRVFEKLKVKYSIGIGLGWSGKTDPFRSGKYGYFIEDRWKADVILTPDSPDELLVLTDEGEYLIGHVGIEVIKGIGTNSNVGLSLNYGHQLGDEEITSFS